MSQAEVVLKKEHVYESVLYLRGFSLHSLLRVCHTACPGSDGDVVVFGGSSNLCIRVDSVGHEKWSVPVSLVYTAGM